MPPTAAATRCPRGCRTPRTPRRGTSAFAASSADRLALERVHGGALEHAAVDAEARAVARAVPGALGAVEVDLTAEVGAGGGDGDQRAGLGAVGRDLLAAVADDVALARREVLDRPPAALGQAVADEPQARLGVLLDQPGRARAGVQPVRV